MILPPSSFSLDGVEEADGEPTALPFAACLVNDVRADGIVVVAVRATRKEGKESEVVSKIRKIPTASAEGASQGAFSVGLSRLD